MTFPAAAIRRLVERVSKERARIPHSELVRFARELELHEASMTVDFAAARAVGLPIVVLKARSAAVLRRLSKRELEVACCIAAGLRNDQIGSRLGIALSTVKDHVHHALEKTGMGSRAELAAAVARSAL